MSRDMVYDVGLGDAIDVLVVAGLCWMALRYLRQTRARPALVGLAMLGGVYLVARWLSLELTDLGVGTEKPFQVHDLLSGARYLWQGSRNYVSLDPAHSPAHIFRIRRRVRTERDFDYFL